MKSNEGKENAINVVKALAVEIFKVLDSEGADRLNWTDFKQFSVMDRQR